MAGIIDVGIGLVVSVIVLVIVDTVISEQTFNSSIMNTLKGFIVPVAGLGVLALAGYMAGAGKR